MFELESRDEDDHDYLKELQMLEDLEHAVELAKTNETVRSALETLLTVYHLAKPADEPRDDDDVIMLSSVNAVDQFDTSWYAC